MNTRSRVRHMSSRTVRACLTVCVEVPLVSVGYFLRTRETARRRRGFDLTSQLQVVVSICRTKPTTAHRSHVSRAQEHKEKCLSAERPPRGGSSDATVSAAVRYNARVEERKVQDG